MGTQLRVTGARAGEEEPGLHLRLLLCHGLLRGSLTCLPSCYGGSRRFLKAPLSPGAEKQDAAEVDICGTLLAAALAEIKGGREEGDAGGSLCQV